MMEVKLEKGEMGRAEEGRGEVELEEVKIGEGREVKEEIGAVERAMKGAVERERCKWQLMRRKRVKKQVSGGGMVSWNIYKSSVFLHGYVVLVGLLIAFI